MPGLWKQLVDAHHYSSHSGMFTQGCGPTGKLSNPSNYHSLRLRERKNRVTRLPLRKMFFFLQHSWSNGGGFNQSHLKP